MFTISPSWSRFVLLCGAVMLALLALMAPAALADSGFGDPVAGQRVYDRAHVLTNADIALLEQHAAQVAQAGAPTIVYLRLQDATYDATMQDAEDLMTAWDVQSKANAHDGVVIFMNLQPANPQHGQVAIYAGAAQLAGNLPANEAQRIYQDVMLPDLRNGQMATALSAALDTITQDLRYGLPVANSASDGGSGYATSDALSEAPPQNTTAAFLARVPLNIVALVLLVGIVGYALWLHSQHAPVPVPAAVTDPPSDLAPGLVGALVAGRVTDAQMEATILDFGRRDALKLESDAAHHLRIRLLDDAGIQDGYERTLWQELADRADAHHVVSANQVATLAANWFPAKGALRQELRKRGWFAAQAEQQRQMLNWGANGALGVAFIGLFPTLIGGEAWGWLGIFALVAAAITGFVAARNLPETTAAGEREAAPWRAYLEGLQRHLPAFDVQQKMQTGIVYAASFGIAAVVEGLFYQASQQGLAPNWMSADQARGRGAWMAYRTVFMPSPTTYNSGSFNHFSGGGFSGGGAGAGGGGGGGGF